MPLGGARVGAALEHALWASNGQRNRQRRTIAATRLQSGAWVSPAGAQHCRAPRSPPSLSCDSQPRTDVLARTVS
eukprot:13191043-Alexandrium_andersonii.AAC.1